MLTVQCPKCEQVLNLREQHLGVKGRCLHCRVPIVAERIGDLDEIQVRLIDGVESSSSADRASEAVARPEPLKVEAPGGDVSLWPGEPAAKPSPEPLAADWSSIFPEPVSVPADTTEPRLFEDASVILDDSLESRQADDGDELDEEELPKAASMVIEAPAWLKTAESKQGNEVEARDSDRDPEQESPPLFTDADAEEGAKSEEEGDFFSDLAEGVDDSETETYSWLTEPEPEPEPESESEEEVQNETTDHGSEFAAFEEDPEVKLEEEGVDAEAGTGILSWLNKSLSASASARQPEASGEPSRLKSQFESLKAVDAEPDTAAESENVAVSDIAEGSGGNAAIELPDWLNEQGAKLQDEQSGRESESVGGEEQVKNSEPESGGEPENEAAAETVEAEKDEPENDPFFSPEQPEVELEVGAAKIFESVPKFGPKFETAAELSGNGMPSSEWTPFEFSDAEEKAKPILSMNPIRPSDFTPNPPTETGESVEKNAEVPGAETGNEETVTSPTESSAKSGAGADVIGDAVAGEDSKPQTVKKSALPPLVGMAGLAAFPLAAGEANEKSDEPDAESAAGGSTPDEGGDQAGESNKQSVLKDSANDGAPAISDSVAATSDFILDPADGQNAEADDSSPVADWLAGTKSDAADSEEPKIFEFETQQASADKDAESTASGEEMDPGRADALARFAARIDGDALEQSADSAEKEEESSDEDSGLLPWEKVEQQAKAKTEGGASAGDEDTGAELASEDGNVVVNLDKEEKEEKEEKGEEDDFEVKEHESAELSEDEAALEAEYASIIPGQANGDGVPATNPHRAKRLKKERRRRILMVLFVLFLGGVGALMYFKPGFRPATLKVAVATSWAEGKTQFDNGKLSDFKAIVGPLIELWHMGPDGGEKETSAPADTATVRTTAPVAPATSPKAVAPPKPAPVSVIPSPQPEVAVTIPGGQKPRAVVARPGALPSGGDDGHAVGTPKGDGEKALAGDSFTHAAPGETEEQRSARLSGEQVLKDFYNARTAEEKLTFIFNANKVSTEIEDAYPSPVDAPTIRSMEFKGRLVDSGTQRPFGVFDVRENENGDRHRWCVPEVSSGKFKVDWGLYRQLANDELTRFLADPGSEPTELRLLLRRVAEVAAEDSPWNEASLEMLVLMPLDDGSPSKILMKRSTHDELGLNRDLGDGMARVGNFQLEWVAGGADGEGSTDGVASATIVAINNWGAWSTASASDEGEKQTSVTPVSDDAGEEAADQQGAVAK